MVTSPPWTQVKLGRLLVPAPKPMIAWFLPTLPLSLALTRLQVIRRGSPGQASTAVVSGEDYSKADNELANEGITFKENLANTSDEITCLVGQEPLEFTIVNVPHSLVIFHVAPSTCNGLMWQGWAGALRNC